MKVMVKGKGGDESAEEGSVHDKKQRTENGALGEATGGGVEGRCCGCLRRRLFVFSVRVFRRFYVFLYVAGALFYTI